MFVDTLVEEKTPVKMLINTSSKFNTISKRLFDKLEEDYGLEGISGDDLIGEEIKYLDLQFCYKRKWQCLDGTELWMHKVKIIFGFSPRTYEHRDKIVIDDINIPLIEGDGRPMDDSKSHKTSSGKNNLPKSDLSIEEITNITKKLLSNAKDNKYQKSHHGIFHNITPVPPLFRRLNNDVLKNSRVNKNKKYPKVDLGDRVFDKFRIIEYELSCINKGKLSWVLLDSSDTSNSSDSSSSRLRSEVIDTYMTTSVKKCPTK
ncbi:9109_t:CDS:2 [Diversispora eburnea]|uniref:9109_t:CDS:1 n=1 Tax=Diversispora eburnea TaxID=1213867 RepID=A0A9N9CYU2_9GLOM|nr:9109_t:CDS:2 [Diversispora eburnea]